jgi:hypothetical protein
MLIPHAGSRVNSASPPRALLLVEDKQKQIPLPPRRSKLWSAARTRDRDDMVGDLVLSLQI